MRPEVRPLSAWLWVLAAALTVVAVIAITSVWLLTIAGHAKAGTDRANARLDAVRTALAAGAGVGAAAGLMLAFRRQRHQEIATALGDHDATERRITELYAKAAEQLGSDKAPVRLAGLYALERLAQDSPNHRQSIVNVLCAYLRMPFEPPAGYSGRPRGVPSLKRGIPGRPSLARQGGPHPDEELLVRKSAQKIIADHLYVRSLSDRRPRTSAITDPNFWPNIQLDLSGAALVDFQFSGRVGIADFSGARFVGGANFAHAEFDGHVYFKNAQFEGSGGHFFGAWFGLRAVFSDADFGDSEANFYGATFAGMTFFDGARFGGGVSFEAARALADFNTSWGSERDWPPGWTERPLRPDEKMPRPKGGRWAKAADPPPGQSKWHVIVPDINRPDPKIH